MKKFIVLGCLLFSVLMGFSQARKPIIMLVPSDNWCISNGYVQEVEIMGKKQQYPDYKMALQKSSDLLLVISKINELMAERGFPLKNLESVLKTLDTDAAEDAVLTSKEGAEMAETPIDRLKRVAKADIWMQITWTLNQVGPKRSVTFNLQGLDAYTDKQIAGASGTGAPSFSTEIPVLLTESVLSHIDNFNAQLENYFDDLFKNGREVALRLKTWSTFEDGFEREFEGKELTAIIKKWMSENTVKGRFSLVQSTEKTMMFEQVRIPLVDADNMSIDAQDWANGLRKMLRKSYSIEAKLMMKGLGQAQLVIGSK